MGNNLLKETIKCLHAHGKEESDVFSVGNDKHRISWECFKRNADFEYDGGYGAQEIYSDLKVYGKDFLMFRNEYDGAEWWEFVNLPDHIFPNCTPEKVSFKKVDNCSYRIPDSFTGDCDVNSNEFSVQFECDLLSDGMD
jgi:hypothetical protein